MKIKYSFFLFFLFQFVLSHAEIPINTPPVAFQSTYEQWKDPSQNFVSYISESDQARVIFIGSEAYSQDNNGQIPTVSEGMGYGLLLSYANNDQTLFDQFLRYILATANNCGCGLFDAQQQTCLAASPFLMPWIVNELGQPFWYQSSPTSEAYFSSGSASDADFQIAWAVFLASKNVKEQLWADSTFETSEGTLNYSEIFEIMGKAIRLSDVNFRLLKYNPGNQWAKAGIEVLYPGYFTPQAFDALNTLPLLDVSDTCPQSTAIEGPASSLQLVYKSNLTQAVSIDYMGGAGTVTPGKHFIPKPGSTTGFTVNPVTTATATCSSTNEYYNNLTFQATFYGASGEPILKANYYFEYNTVDNVLEWRMTDNGSSPQAKVCLQGNVAYIFLTEPDIEKVNFSWSDVKNNSLLYIQSFQEKYKTGLFPNTIYLNGNYPLNNWNLSFGYDAVRFPLWASSYCYSTNPKNITSSLQRTMVSNLLKGVLPFLKPLESCLTMPSNGINVFTKEEEGGYTFAAPALNGPLALAALFSGEMSVYELLIPSVTSYQIIENQPAATDATGDSGPYFNAVILLLTEALISGKF